MVIVDINRIPKDLREPAREAERGFKWNVVSRKKNGYLMSSPGGTETFYIPFKTNNPVLEAKRFRMAMAKAALTEGGSIQEIAEKALVEQGAHMQVECSGCDQTFLTMEGYKKHPCPGGHVAPLADAEATVDTSHQGEGERPAEGHTEPVSEDGEPVRGSFGSGSMSNKEEDMVVKGEKRGSYRKSAKVEPGLARVIYETLRDSPQWKTEASSAYANRIADKVATKVSAQEMPEPAGAVPSASDEEVAALAAELADAREALARITQALGIDMSALEEAQELREKNRLLQENLGTLGELLEGIKKI